MNDPQTELDAMHMRHQPFTMSVTGRLAHDIVQCATCLTSWPCDASVLIAGEQQRMDSSLFRAARNLSDRRTLMDDGFWVSQKEMRALDEALAAVGE